MPCDLRSLRATTQRQGQNCDRNWMNAGAPLATALISLAVLGLVPGPIKAAGIVLALVASLLLAIEPDTDGAEPTAAAA